MAETVVAILILLGGAAAALWGVSLLDRAWEGFLLRRFRDRLRKTPLVGSVRARLSPESLFIVELSDSGVSCRRPDQTVESVAWDDLQSVEILNNDEGPWSADVLWVLHGSAGGCVIPQGATGDAQLLERLQQLPGFDNEAVIRAMGIVTNQRTVCWRNPVTRVS